jgi:hypothetical protein
MLFFHCSDNDICVPIHTNNFIIRGLNRKLNSENFFSTKGTLENTNSCKFDIMQRATDVGTCK